MDRCETKFDLEERTQLFAKRVRALCKSLMRTIANDEDSRQLIRSSGSVGANYIEANEPLGTKDFLVHIKICREEAKETRYWLGLLDLEQRPQLNEERAALIQEATELLLIFAAIIRNRTQKV
jgi:four helix bundle protein